MQELKKGATSGFYGFLIMNKSNDMISHKTGYLKDSVNFELCDKSILGKKNLKIFKLIYSFVDQTNLHFMLLPLEEAMIMLRFPV